MSKNLDKHIDIRLADFRHIMCAFTSRFVRSALRLKSFDAAECTCSIDGRPYKFTLIMEKYKLQKDGK